MLKLPPLSLYIHVPWCVKKCPYCDFNSHQLKGDIPEQEYVDALLRDFSSDAAMIQGRKLESIFIGGGTPSLLSADAYQRLFSGLRSQIDFSDNMEITLEANPGTYEHDRFQAYLDAGINRLSIGVQSFQNEKLKALGRIHSAEEAIAAIQSLADSGFSNFNIDLMHGLPNQTEQEAMADLNQAVELQPAHISWYQLTIEPNTVFYSKTPVLPPDDTLWSIQEKGQVFLEEQGFGQYEISAYSRPGKQAKHNLNYWQFADYIGIGAGAHGKLTDMATRSIFRTWKTRTPTDYLSSRKILTAGRRVLDPEDMPIEFMMNVLRLNDGIPREMFTDRTGQNVTMLQKSLDRAFQKKLLENNHRFQPTKLGRLFLNDLLELF